VRTVSPGRALRAVLSFQPAVRPGQSLGRGRPSPAQGGEASRVTPRSEDKGRAPSQAEAITLKEAESSLKAGKTKRRRVKSGRDDGRGYNLNDVFRETP
jgi:hypothetical protein